MTDGKGGILRDATFSSLTTSRLLIMKPAGSGLQLTQNRQCTFSAPHEEVCRLGDGERPATPANPRR